MRTIWKYDLSKVAPNNLNISSDSKICHFGIDYKNGICLWAEQGDETPAKKRVFIIVGTGESFIDNCQHHYSIIADGFVWHLLEVLQ